MHGLMLKFNVGGERSLIPSENSGIQGDTEKQLDSFPGCNPEKTEREAYRSWFNQVLAENVQTGNALPWTVLNGKQ